MRIIISKVKIIVEWIATFALRSLIDGNANKYDYKFFVTENIYNPFFNKENFKVSLLNASPYTIISTYKFQTLYWALQESPLGNVLDIGVLRGGSSIFFANLLENENLIYSVDNWSEHAKPNSDSLLTYSSCSDLEDFKKAIIDLKISKRINICDCSLKTFLAVRKSDLVGTIAVIHFDLYDSSTFDDTVEDMLKLLKRGGCLLIAGYGSLALPKLSKSVDLFAKSSKYYTRFLQDKSGYGIFIKI